MNVNDKTGSAPSFHCLARAIHKLSLFNVLKCREERLPEGKFSSSPAFLALRPLVLARMRHIRRPKLKAQSRCRGWYRGSKLEAGSWKCRLCFQETVRSFVLFILKQNSLNRNPDEITTIVFSSRAEIGRRFSFA